MGRRAPSSPGAMPATIPVFPLAGALLLPRGDLPLNVFEPRYLEMVDDALAGDRLIGMIQPRLGPQGPDAAEPPALADVGCAGRLTAFRETGDGRYLVTLSGIARFRVVAEPESGARYRVCRIDSAPFAADFSPGRGEASVDRPRLIAAFRAFLRANELETEWASVERTSTESLVNALATASPCGPAEKQALLEAHDLAARAEMLVAMTEMSLARRGDDAGTALQ